MKIQHRNLLLWLFLLLSSYAATPSTAVIVHIDTDKGHDASGCVPGLSSHPCQNLHYAVKVFIIPVKVFATNSYRNTTFLLLSDIPLQNVITFTSCHNITYAGAHKQLLCDERKCDRTRFRLLFENS